jgi:hypothetical protein
MQLPLDLELGNTAARRRSRMERETAPAYR